MVSPSRCVSWGVGLLVLLIVLSAWWAFSPPVALALPEGRVYEMVSPVYKGGYGVSNLDAVASNGNSVSAVFESFGVFAGDPGSNAYSAYIARRGDSGWSSVPLRAPVTVSPYAIPQDYSADLEKTADVAIVGENAGLTDYLGSEDEFLLHGTATVDTFPNWEAICALILKQMESKPEHEYLALREASASPDLSHILFYSPKPLLAGAPKTGQQLYDISTDCEPGLQLVGLNDQGKPLDEECPVSLGASDLAAPESEFHAVSGDGSEIFFTSPTQPGSACALSSSQLFVRLGGERTLEVSRPLGAKCEEVPCVPEAFTRAPSEFQGASEDGSRVFFTTTEALADEDRDKAEDLYMATIGCPGGTSGCEASQREVTSLALVSHGAGMGEAAEVQGVVRIAPDGERAYFVARGVLSANTNVEGQMAVKGADNLYVYESGTGTVAFVADLCSGPVLSGEAEDAYCPSNLDLADRNDRRLWTKGGAQSTGDGRFLVFSTFARLSRQDTDDASDVYRYDAVSGALDRVSLGEQGYDVDGNGVEPSLGAYDAKIPEGALFGGGASYSYSQLEMGSRAVSENGSRIVFESAEPLSVNASNGLVNVYEWHKEPGWTEGVVSLVSSGTADESDTNATITPSGQDLFFVTSQGLVPVDNDGARDVYDARLHGGFPVLAAEPQPCSGEACYGPLTNPAPLLVPSSAVQPAGENVAQPKPALPKKKSKSKPKKKKKKKRKAGRAARTHHGGRAAARGRTAR